MRNEELRAILQAIEDANGRFSPDLVVETARDVNHPLHSQFEWDDEVAGHKWRLEQASALIRRARVTFTINETAVTVPAYVHDPAAEPDERRYISVAKLRHDEDDSHTALVQEFAAAGAHLRRARDLAQVLGHGKKMQQLMDVFDATTTNIIATLGKAARDAAGWTKREQEPRPSNE